MISIKNNIPHDLLNIFITQPERYKRFIESGKYSVDQNIDHKQQYTILSYWAINDVKKKHINLILSLNPNKTIQFQRNKIKKIEGPPLFHVSTYFRYNSIYNRYSFALIHIQNVCDKLRMILDDGYDFGYKCIRTGYNLLQHYTEMRREYGRVCGHEQTFVCSKGNKCYNCILKKLYSKLAKIVRGYWLKQVTLFELMIYNRDLTRYLQKTQNKKQRTK